MKKLLTFGAWIIGIAIAVGTIIFVAGEQHAAREKSEAARQKDCAALAITFEQKYSCAKEAQSRHDYLPWWYVLVAWPDGVTPWIVIATGLFIALQTRETRRAAEGAFLNAQAVINAERPWLLVTLEEVSGPGTGFIIRAKNKGRTPAMIMSARIGCVVAENVEKLPKEPPYGDGSLVQDHIVIPEDEPSVGWFDLNALNKMTGNKAAWLEGQTFVFGIVLYRDLLDLSQTKPHETRWIYAYYPARGEFGDSVLPAGGLGVSHEYDNYS